jgi:N-acetylglutamate synthase-like GNAT family acetyltransferase/ferredoxin
MNSTGPSTASRVHLATREDGGFVVVLRSATPGDANALHRLSRPFAATGELVPRTPDDYGRVAADFLVAEVDGGVVGCCGAADHPDDVAEIYNICVGRSQQGRGIGTLLLRAQLDERARAGTRRFVLLASSAHRWYEALGFRGTDLSRLPAERLRQLDGSRRSTPMELAVPAPSAPRVTFRKSGVVTPFTGSEEDCLLHVAEDRGVRMRSLCQAGVCGTCRTGLRSGTVVYDMPPLYPVKKGQILPCIAKPVTDVVVDA